MTFVLPVKHVKQQSDWDCGVTCLKMLIDYYHLDLSLFNNLLESYECNNSTWTIDLLYLLHQSGIHAVLHTITIGCSSKYEDTPYYQRSIPTDQERVNKLFVDKASDVKLGSIEWSDLKKHLHEQQTPCIVLIDANKLECTRCKKSLFEQFFDKLLSKLSSSSYQGHYVLLIGYEINNDQELVYYVDPAGDSQYCTTTVENFNMARTAFGTDEDTILCYKKT